MEITVVVHNQQLQRVLDDRTGANVLQLPCVAATCPPDHEAR